MKRKYSTYVTKTKMKEVRVVYIMQIIEVLLPVYLNGIITAPIIKDVTVT